MPAAIFRISPVLKENWNRAIRSELWDTTTAIRKIDIEPGTQIFFWMNGDPHKPGQQQFVGRAIARTNLYEINEHERVAGPWAESDESKLRYRYRVNLDQMETVTNVPEPSEASTRSRQLGLDLGTTIAQQSVLTIEDPSILHLINHKYFSGSPIELSQEFDNEVLPELSPGVEAELRQTLQKHRKQGYKFKQLVAKNFRDKCALTGEKTAAVLEAAHIIAFNTEEHTDRANNGVLLRVDIHRLFDRHLITFVEKGGKVIAKCNDALQDTEYWEFQDQPLNESVVDLDPIALQNHNAACQWLESEFSR